MRVGVPIWWRGIGWGVREQGGERDRTGVVEVGLNGGGVGANYFSSAENFLCMRKLYLLVIY